MKWYLKALRQYVDFSGRARRTEYWMFILFNVIYALSAMAVDNALGITFHFTGPDGAQVSILYGFIYVLYSLAVFLPSFAVAVRRLHDVGKSGWMLLVGLIPIIGAIWLLILFCTNSQDGTNKWGPNPKEPLADFLEFGQA
ncbi:MAG: DUF805 domain-containing protein [Flavisolibacter sp.]